MVNRIIYLPAAYPAVGAYESRFLRLSSLAVHVAFTKGAGAAFALLSRTLQAHLFPRTT